MADSPYVAITDLAKHFQVSVSTIRLWIRRGVIPPENYLKVGNTFRFRLPEVEEAVRSFNTKRLDEKLAAAVPVDQDM
jgi:excisionase family DNA binding protein